VKTPEARPRRGTRQKGQTLHSSATSSTVVGWIMRAPGVLSLVLVLLLAAVALSAEETSESLAAFKKEAPACTRFASPHGSDSAAGTTRRPFRTAQRLADSLRPGQTGCLHGGTYSDDGEDFVVTFRRAGRPGAPITIRSHPGERARILGTVYVARGADHVTISGLTLEGQGQDSTLKVNAADVVIRSNDITNAWRGVNCIILGSNNGWGGAVRPVIRGNRVHECGTPGDSLEHGLYAANAVGGRIVGNRMWNVAGYAMQLYPNSQHMLVSRNVVDGGEPSVRGGIVVGGDDDYASNDNVIEHNVIAYAQTWNVTSEWEGSVGHGNVARSNCLWGGGRGNLSSDGGLIASKNKVADPRFVDRARRNYRLAVGSPCRAVLE
jgi:Right handed beta helix region